MRLHNYIQITMKPPCATFSDTRHVVQTTKLSFPTRSTTENWTTKSWHFIQLFRERLWEKCARDNPARWYGIWSIHCSWHRSCRTYFCRFPSALANIHPWPLVVPFFQISLKNSELKTIHNTFRDCRVHFFRQPFSNWIAVYATSSKG